MSPRSLPSVFHATAYVTQSARRNQSESPVQLRSGERAGLCRDSRQQV